MIAHPSLSTKVIQVNSRRTLELVDGDYSVMTELADTLLREADDPFRVGHEVASQLAADGRSQGKRPIDLTHKEVADVYRKVTGKELSLSPEQVRQAMSRALRQEPEGHRRTSA